MKPFKLMIATLASAAAVAAAATPALADVSPLTFGFYDCTGPAGTPSAF